MSLLDYTDLARFVGLSAEAEVRRGALQRAVEVGEIAYAHSISELVLVASETLLSDRWEMSTGRGVRIDDGRLHRVLRCTIDSVPVDLDLTSIWSLSYRREWPNRGTYIMRWDHGFASPRAMPDDALKSLLRTTEEAFISTRRTSRPSKRRTQREAQAVAPLGFNREQEELAPGRVIVEASAGRSVRSREPIDPDRLPEVRG